MLLAAPFVVWNFFGSESAVGLGMMLSIAFSIGSNAVVEWPIIIDTIRRGSGSEAWHAYLPVRDRRIRLSVPCGLAAAAGAAVFLLR